MADGDLINQIVNFRDDTSWEELFRRHNGWLEFVVGVVLRGDGVFDVTLIQDVTQTCWLAIVNCINRFDSGRACFRTWAAEIARNKARDEIRTRRRRKESQPRGSEDAEFGGTPFDRVEGVCPLPWTDLLKREDAEVFWAAVRQLPERYRQLICWRAEGRSNQEIAAELSVTNASVGQWVHRALERIRVIIYPNGESAGPDPEL